MNSIKILIALLAVCTLTVPAFSMSDRGMGHAFSEGNQDLCDCKKPMVEDKCQECMQNPCACDCSKTMMPPEGRPVRSMMGDRCKSDQQGDQQGDQQNPCGPLRGQMGQGPENLPVKSMMCQKFQGEKEIPEQNPCECAAGMTGQEGRPVRSMMCQKFQGDGPNSCEGPKPMMEDECNKGN